MDKSFSAEQSVSDHCPICDGGNLDFSVASIEEGFLTYPWECRICGASGAQYEDCVFSGHDVKDDPTKADAEVRIEHYRATLFSWRAAGLILSRFLSKLLEHEIEVEVRLTDKDYWYMAFPALITEDMLEVIYDTIQATEEDKKNNTTNQLVRTLSMEVSEKLLLYALCRTNTKTHVNDDGIFILSPLT